MNNGDKGNILYNVIPSSTLPYLSTVEYPKP